MNVSYYVRSAEFVRDVKAEAFKVRV